MWLGAVLLPKPFCVKIYLHYCILNSSFSQSMEDNSLFYTGKWLRKKHWLGGWMEACGACASQAKGEVGGMLLLHAYSDIVIDTLKGLQLFFVLIWCVWVVQQTCPNLLFLQFLSHAFCALCCRAAQPLGRGSGCSPKQS